MFKWETRLAEFPTGAVYQRVGIFLSSLKISDRFFSHMSSRNRAFFSRCLHGNAKTKLEKKSTKNQQNQIILYQNVPFILTKLMDTHT